MQTDTKHQVYAGFFVRLAAFLVDMIIVNVGLMVVRIPMWVLSISSPDNVFVRDFIFQYSVVDIVKYLLTALYFVLLTYYTGSTFGKKLFQLRVISTENRKLTLFEVAYRETIGRFLSAVIMQLGYLLVIVQKEHRGVHDLLSDTCVIYYHEKKVYMHTQMNYRNMAPSPGYTVPPMQGGGNMSGNGDIPPNAPGNVPPMSGSMAPNMPGNRNVPPNVQGNVPPGYFSAPQGDNVSGPGTHAEKEFASQETESSARSVEETASMQASVKDSTKSDFVSPGEENQRTEVPFERNE